MSEPTVEVAWIVEHPKIVDYLLNPSHPQGGSKAKYLMGFGFTPHDPGALALALVEHAIRSMPGRTVVPPKGRPRVVFDGTIAAPDGRDMPLRTVWEPKQSPREMRFITAVPRTK